MAKPLRVDELRQVLRDKIKTEPVVCKTKLIRELLVDIRRLKELGHTYSKIAGWLNSQDGRLNFSSRQLAVIIYRISKKKSKSKTDRTDQLPMFERTSARKKFTIDPTDTGHDLI